MTSERSRDKSIDTNSASHGFLRSLDGKITWVR